MRTVKVVGQAHYIAMSQYVRFQRPLTSIMLVIHPHVQVAVLANMAKIPLYILEILCFQDLSSQGQGLLIKANCQWL